MVKELLELLKEISGVNKPIVFSQGTPGDQKGIIADTKLMEKFLGFNCRYNLRSGLKEMIEWAKMQTGAGAKV